MRIRGILSIVFAVLAIIFFWFGWSLIAAVVFALLAVILAFGVFGPGVLSILWFVFCIVIFVLAVVFLILFLSRVLFLGFGAYLVLLL
jgi:hypothetical protein